MGENKLDAPLTETQAPAGFDAVRLNLNCAEIRHYPPEHADSPEGMGIIALDYWVNGQPFCEYQCYRDKDFPGAARAGVVATQQAMALHAMTRHVSKMLAEGKLT